MWFSRLLSSAAEIPQKKEKKSARKAHTVEQRGLNSDLEIEATPARSHDTKTFDVGFDVEPPWVLLPAVGMGGCLLGSRVRVRGPHVRCQSCRTQQQQ